VLPYGEYNAMSLATSTPKCEPSVRMVILKWYEEDTGFVFATNYTSRKGLIIVGGVFLFFKCIFGFFREELMANRKAALCIWWARFNRVVRVEGEVDKTSKEESDQLWRERSKESRISAVVSPQSQPVEREEMEREWKALVEKYEGTEDIPRPEEWGGIRVKPKRFEFWQSGDYRLHDRFIYEREEGEWKIQRLGP